MYRHRNLSSWVAAVSILIAFLTSISGAPGLAASEVLLEVSDPTGDFSVTAVGSPPPDFDASKYDFTGLVVSYDEGAKVLYVEAALAGEIPNLTAESGVQRFLTVEVYSNGFINDTELIMDFTIGGPSGAFAGVEAEVALVINVEFGGSYLTQAVPAVREGNKLKAEVQLLTLPEGTIRLESADITVTYVEVGGTYQLGVSDEASWFMQPEGTPQPTPTETETTVPPEETTTTPPVEETPLTAQPTDPSIQIGVEITKAKISVDPTTGFGEFLIEFRGTSGGLHHAAFAVSFVLPGNEEGYTQFFNSFLGDNDGNVRDGYYFSMEMYGAGIEVSIAPEDSEWRSFSGKFSLKGPVAALQALYGISGFENLLDTYLVVRGYSDESEVKWNHVIVRVKPEAETTVTTPPGYTETTVEPPEETATAPPVEDLLEEIATDPSVQVSISLSESRITISPELDEAEVRLLGEGTTSGANHVAVALVFQYRNGTRVPSGWINAYGAYDIDGDSSNGFTLDLEIGGVKVKAEVVPTSDNWETFKVDVRVRGPIRREELIAFNPEDIPDRAYVVFRAFKDPEESMWNQVVRDVSFSIAPLGEEETGTPIPTTQPETYPPGETVTSPTLPEGGGTGIPVTLIIGGVVAAVVVAVIAVFFLKRK